MDARNYLEQLPFYRIVGISCLHRGHCDHLALVRHVKSAPRVQRPDYRHYDVDQNGEGKIRMDHRRPRYFMAFVTMYAGYLNITQNYLPKGKYLLAALSSAIMILMAVLFVAAFKRWYELLRVKEAVADKYGDLVLDLVEE